LILYLKVLNKIDSKSWPIDSVIHPDTRVRLLTLTTPKDVQVKVKECQSLRVGGKARNVRTAEAEFVAEEHVVP